MNVLVVVIVFFLTAALGGSLSVMGGAPLVLPALMAAAFWYGRWVDGGLWAVATVVSQLVVPVPWMIVLGAPLLGAAAYAVNVRWIHERLVMVFLAPLGFVPVLVLSGYTTVPSVVGSCLLVATAFLLTWLAYFHRQRVKPIVQHSL